MGVQSLLAGIVVNTALYSVNMALTGNRATLAMNKTPTVFTMAKDLLRDTPMAGQSTLLVMFIITVLVICFLCFFLKTKLGLAIRATGSNADMVRSSSINPTFTTTVGLCVSNALTGLSGCLMAQQQKNFEINMGSGMVTVALASLLIGGVFVAKYRPIPLRAVGAVLGAVVFRLVYALALRFNMPAFMLKAVSAVIVVLAISGPYLRKQLPLMIRRIRAAREGGEADA
jgi:putative ABC transport system permease protein